MKWPKRFSRFFHRWIGIGALFFLTMFCISGIVLNHRDLFGHIDVPRQWLPSQYHIRNLNQGVVKGTIALTQDSVLAFGSQGFWLTDRKGIKFHEYNVGLPDNSQDRNIRNCLTDSTGTIWGATPYAVYKLMNNQWIEEYRIEKEEKIADVAINPLNGRLMMLSRSNLYELSESTLQKIAIPAPDDQDIKVTLFKTIWHLHSGELFGFTGKLIVDAIGVILIFLSVTGIVILLLPISIRHKARKYNSTAREGRVLKSNLNWHKKIGWYTLALTLSIGITGVCLRPPLMIPCVMSKVPVIKGTSLHSPNPWHDKLRNIRWDNHRTEWLLSTSDGFYKIDSGRTKATPIPKRISPPVSPMGINVMHQADTGVWLIGSYAGMFKWNPDTGEVVDWFTELPSKTDGRPVSENLVAGYSEDFDRGPIVFDYNKGTVEISEIEGDIPNQTMSLWNLALEIHSGRFYTSIIGELGSTFFIFFSGVLFIVLLISGCRLMTASRIRCRQ